MDNRACAWMGASFCCVPTLTSVLATVETLIRKIPLLWSLHSANAKTRCITANNVLMNENGAADRKPR